MTGYLSYTLTDNDAFVSTFDELPLWSAPFGLLLLKHLELRPNTTVIDIGSGTGFPLLELAGRLGTSCKLYGIDPWVNANKRAKEKIKNYGLANVEIIETSADNIPLKTGTIDLIVSNLGINNFENPAHVLAECYRVLKPKGKIAFTTNLTGHWKEFYKIFYSTLILLGKQHLVPSLQADEEHRGTVKSVSGFFTACGLDVTKIIDESFEMKFVDGSAFLNHHFVKPGWLTTWIKLFPKAELQEIFSALEQNLNAYASANNGLVLTVPMAYIEGEKR